MANRHVLDLRAGIPWSAEHRSVFAAAASGGWGNPAHHASEGRRAATWLQAAEATVRDLTGFAHVAFHADRDAALRTLARTLPGSVSASATARRSVLALCQHVADVDHDGRVIWGNSDDLRILQGANEETGVIDAVDGSSEFVVDGSNSVGRVPTTPTDHAVVADAATWGAPGGIALVLSPEPLVEATMTPPLPLIAVAVQALAAHWPNREARARDEASAMARLEADVVARIPDVQFHGIERVSHIRSFSVLHLDAETLTRALDVEGYVVGSGSACVADGTPSHVLAAMGAVTHGNVRLALPVDLALDVLDEFAQVLAATVTRLRREAGVEAL